MVLPQVGAELVLKGQEAFISGAKNAQKAIEGIGDSAVKAAGQTSAIDRISESMKAVGTRISGIGRVMTGAFTLPLVGFGTLAVMSASSLEESMNKVQVVFGESADAIKKFADGASTNLGMSEQAALDAAGTFGNLFTSMGIGQEVSADMSSNLLTLAADLASFNNIDPAVALDKLRAGLVGETEPLRTLGVNLTAVAVEAKAMAMGLASTKDEITPAIAAQARYALILEQTQNAQGDFARTSDSLANKMRIVKAQLADTAAGFGQVLLPIIQKVADFMSKLLERFMAMSPATRTVIVVILAIVAAIGPLLMIVGSLISAIGAIIPVVAAVAAVLTGPILLAIGAVIAVIALLALAWKNNWGGIQEKTAAVVNFIKGLIQSGLAAIQNFWQAHGAQIMAVVKALWSTIVSVFNTAVVIIKTVIAAFQAAMAGDWRKFGELMRKAWDMLWRAIITAVVNAGKMLKTVVTNLVNSVKTWFANIDWAQVGKNIVTGIANGITSAAKWIKDAAMRAIKAAIDAVKGFLGLDSPSRLFFEFGENMMLGLAKGIESLAKIPEIQVTGAIRGIIESIEADRRQPSGDGESSLKIPEAIIAMTRPVSAPAMATAGGNTFNLTNNISATVRDDQDLHRLSYLIAREFNRRTDR